MTSSTITCEAFDAALPDYLEGTLDEKRLAAVDGHLSECVRCTSLLRDLENISRDAAALPELVPSRDLWDGIEARIAAPVIPLASRAERKRRMAPAWMGIAAAALVVSTAGVTYVLTARSIRPASEVVAVVNAPASQAASPAGGSSNPTSTVGEPDVATSNATGGTTAESNPRLATRTPTERQTSAAAQFVTADQAHSDAVYDREIEMLQTIVSQRKTGLDSSTVAIIEKNLKIIDTAIQQSRAALVRDPASRLLGQQLTHALDKKVELLRTAAMLPAST
jgi:hypothetical protein